ncbi:hypothetical protein B0O99DRAFT_588004 [Bisporella sp. PMI_857]|nr:hypothetical protein B0O99DRAFT_588004 [Bisporella sp. PMI_857]
MPPCDSLGSFTDLGRADIRNPEQMVTFLIGPEGKKFLIHEEAACVASSVLKAAFRGPFIEGQKKTYRLHHTSVEAFRYLSQYLYSGNINFATHNPDHTHHWASACEEERKAHEKICCDQDQHLFKLWVLADELIIPHVQNIAVEQILRVFSECGWETSEIEYVYKNTAADSPLRHLCVQMAAWDLPSNTLGEELEALPKQFSIDLAVAFSKSSPKDAKTRRKKAMIASYFFVKTESNK